MKFFKKFKKKTCELQSNENRNEDSIVFPISRYEQHKFEIKFPDKVTERDAVIAMQKYLSHPMTKEYFERIKGDCIITNWEEAVESL